MSAETLCAREGCGHPGIKHGSLTSYCFHWDDDSGYCQCIGFVEPASIPEEGTPPSFGRGETFDNVYVGERAETPPAPPTVVNVRVTQDVMGTTPVLKCEECDYLTFDLTRLAEIHCRGGALRLAAVEGLPHGAPNVRRAVLYNPLCYAVYTWTKQEMQSALSTLQAQHEALEAENSAIYAGIERDSVDAERWRYVRQLFSVESDVENGGEYLFMHDDTASTWDLTFAKGCDHTVESLIDIRRSSLLATPHPSETEAP